MERLNTNYGTKTAKRRGVYTPSERLQSAFIAGKRPCLLSSKSRLFEDTTSQNDLSISSAPGNSSDIIYSTSLQGYVKLFITFMPFI